MKINTQFSETYLINVQSIHAIKWFNDAQEMMGYDECQGVENIFYK